MARRKQKGHARRGKALRRRYGRSFAGGALRMDVSGQLVLNPERLEEVIEAAVENAVEEVAPDLIEEIVPEVVADIAPEALEAADYYGGM